MDDAESGLHALERRDLEEQLAAKEAQVRKHTFWAVLGVSPGAILPLIFSLGELGIAALVVGVVAMTVLEVWRAYRAQAEVTAIERSLRALEAGEEDSV